MGKIGFLVWFFWGMIIYMAISLIASAQTLQPDRSHHTKNGFRNLNHFERPGFLDFLKWRFSGKNKTDPPVESYKFPIGKNDPQFLKSNRHRQTLTWIGHATLLLQINGKNILTDPHFSERASPVQWAGPKRIVPPGLALEDLPAIDMVVISHDHYDSLDKQSVRQLHKRPGGQATVFFCPLGLKKWFAHLGITRVIELDWWEEHMEGELNIIPVPLQHWSKRNLFTENKTLWAGWVIRTPHFSFFFCGDSGYTPYFKEIGNHLGPFDLAAIPIGAYEPRWFMRFHHMSPEEAIQVHLDVRAKKSIAIHWGTFMLTDEPLDEPPKKLKAAKIVRGLPSEVFTVLQHGETVLTGP